MCGSYLRSGDARGGGRERTLSVHQSSRKPLTLVNLHFVPCLFDLGSQLLSLLLGPDQREPPRPDRRVVVSDPKDWETFHSFPSNKEKQKGSGCGNEGEQEDGGLRSRRTSCQPRPTSLGSITPSGPVRLPIGPVVPGL